VDDESADTAQATLEEVIDGEENSLEDVLGSTDPEDIEKEFGINLDDIEEAPADNPFEVDPDDATDYKRLDMSRRDVRNKIQEKYEDDPEMYEAVHKVSEYLYKWKGKSSNAEAATMEAIAQKALNIDRDIRDTGDVKTEDVNKNTAQAYRDYARISKAFLDKNVADENGNMQLERGMNSKTNTYSLIEQMIAHPNADAYELDGSVLANYTTSRDVSNDFTKTFRIEQELSTDDVAMAQDMVGYPRSPLREAEIHITGDSQIIDSENIRVPDEVGTSTFGSQKELEETLKTVQNPEEATSSEQLSFYSAVKRWGSDTEQESRYAPENEQARNALRNVAVTASNSDNWSDHNTRSVRKYVARLLDDQELMND